MTDIEKKALALLKEVLKECGYTGAIVIDRNCEPQAEALCRAIEQHEAFRQEVSDAASCLLELHQAVGLCLGDGRVRNLHRFIIAKPVDPLVEALRDVGHGMAPLHDQIRAAIEKRGGKIVWEEG